MPMAMSAPALSALCARLLVLQRISKSQRQNVERLNCIHNGIKAPDSLKFMSGVPKRATSEVVFTGLGRSKHVINDLHDLAPQRAEVSSQGQVKLYSSSHLRRT